MISIFFDLETTDLEPVGQIINFAFVAVDESFKTLESFSSKVKISRLQLPRIDAVLINRTNVLQHQEEAGLTENEAVSEINQFIQRWLTAAKGEPIAFVGFNSAAFDLNFLRTVFIRNGFKPYYPNLISRDVLLVARYLMARDDSFAEQVFRYFGEEKVSLKLESLCKIFSLLDDLQSHESLADVKLTIALAKRFLKEFGVDVRTFEPYQIKELHRAKRGTVFQLEEPVGSQIAKDRRVVSYPATLLDENGRYALWVDLEKFKSAAEVGSNFRPSIRWQKFVDDLVLRSQQAAETEYDAVAEKALLALKGVSLSNFFEETNCDIEQFIYRIKPNEIGLIQKGISGAALTDAYPRDVKHLVKRYWLENFQGEETKEFLDSLKKYARYRYGGALQLNRLSDPESSDLKPKPKLHPTFTELLRDIDKVLEKSSTEDAELAQALRQFYFNSDLYRVAGEELLAGKVVC